MSEDAGSSLSAVAAVGDALSARHDAVVTADHTLAAAVIEAHAVTVDALGRLDAISAEIENAVAQQHLLALDTAAGAREFQHFLLARHRDIIAVVSEAANRADAAAAQVQGLAASYREVNPVS
jgi:hypothetical protein